ncbi:hypothetical protein [Calidifontibacter terrae]
MNNPRFSRCRRFLAAVVVAAAAGLAVDAIEATGHNLLAAGVDQGQVTCPVQPSVPATPWRA